MSWSIFVSTMRQRAVALFWFTFGLVLYAWLMMWYWPLLGDQYAELIENIPANLLAAFAGSEVDIATLGGYLQTEYLGLMWIAIVTSAVVLYASKSIASEVKTGTMELLLAQPVSRMQVVLTRIAGLFVFVAVLATASFITLGVFGPVYDVDVTWRAVWLMMAEGSLLMLAIGGFAFMVSSVSSDGGKPAGITAAIVGGMWILHAVAALADWADALEPFNLLRYWQPADIVNEGTVSPETLWVYGGIAVVTLVASVVLFRRRDLT